MSINEEIENEHIDIPFRVFGVGVFVIICSICSLFVFFVCMSTEDKSYESQFDLGKPRGKITAAFYSGAVLALFGCFWGSLERYMGCHASLLCRNSNSVESDAEASVSFSSLNSEEKVENPEVALLNSKDSNCTVQTKKINICNLISNSSVVRNILQYFSPIIDSISSCCGNSVNNKEDPDTLLKGCSADCSENKSPVFIV